MEERSWVPVEFYVPTQVLCGFIYISSELRLLDILNRVGLRQGDVVSDYIEFINTVTGETEIRKNTRYVRKDVVELAAIAEADLARGIGGKDGQKTYPYATKSPVHVSVVTPVYTLDGSMHCTSGRNVRETLDEKSLFLPLTDVTMSVEGRFYGKRPFVAARKDQIILLKEE